MKNSSKIDMSFGENELWKSTAQFFNPKQDTKQEKHGQKIPKQYKKKRENSMPINNLVRYEEPPSILHFPQRTHCPRILTKQQSYRKNTIPLLNTIVNSNKQLTTQESTNESLIKLLKKDNNKLKHSQSSYVVPQKYKSIPLKEKIVENSIITNTISYKFPTRESRTNSRCSVVSQGADGKRRIKVNDPYGLFTAPDIIKHSSKQSITLKAQAKIVDKIFSSRSDSIQ